MTSNNAIFSNLKTSLKTISCSKLIKNLSLHYQNSHFKIFNKRIFIHLYIDHKWFATHRVLKSCTSKTGVIKIKYALCSGCWALFASLVLAMFKRTSCAQVHQLPQSYCGDNREDTLFSRSHIYYAHLASATFERTVYVMYHLWPLILCSMLN